MKNRPNKATRAARQTPLDHLRPGGRRDSDPSQDARPLADQASASPPTQPADPATTGAGKGGAERGKATGSPAAVATRPHLEDSGQSPR